MAPSRRPKIRTAEGKTLKLMRTFEARYRSMGLALSFEDAQTLRRAALTLHAWDEKRCGWSTDGPYGASFALVRDEDGDDKPYLEIHPNSSLKTRWERIPDREAGALRRVADVCKRNGLQFYHQGDPRGCSLYIAKTGLQPEEDFWYAELILNDRNYHWGTAIAK